MARRKGSGGGLQPSATPRTASTAEKSGKLFQPPKPFELPRLSSIEILAKGKRSRSEIFNTSPYSSETRLMRLVSRAPEVMVKVTGGGMSSGQIQAHLEYISRNGKLEVETDQGDILTDKDEVTGFVEGWDVDTRSGAGNKRQAYNIMLSMPQGTDPEQVRLSARAFAKEQFGNTYPWAMVLHTDKAHPHVHICVRMTPEDRREKKLFIRKDTLESYRQRFADKLIERGIEAAATPRELRGVTRKSKKIAVYHAEKSMRSTVARAKMESAVKEFRTKKRDPEPWKERIKKRRNSLLKHYECAITELELKNKFAQAQKVRNFVADLPPIETERDTYRKYIDSRFSVSQKEPVQERPEVTQQVQSGREYMRKSRGHEPER